MEKLVVLENVWSVQQVMTRARRAYRVVCEEADVAVSVELAIHLN